MVITILSLKSLVQHVQTFWCLTICSTNDKPHKKKENQAVLFICDVLRSVDSLTFSSKFVVVYRGLSVGSQQVLHSVGSTPKEEINRKLQ